MNKNIEIQINNQISELNSLKFLIENCGVNDYEQSEQKLNSIRYSWVNIRNCIKEELAKKELELEEEKNKAAEEQQSVSNRRYSKSF